MIISRVLQLCCSFSVSEMSDENMMDPSNLAICFGPTLMPVPSDRDQVFYQTYVNELIKNIIVHYETVFPFDGGVVYERFIVPGEGYVLVTESYLQYCSYIFTCAMHTSVVLAVARCLSVCHKLVFF